MTKFTKIRLFVVLVVVSLIFGLLYYYNPKNQTEYSFSLPWDAQLEGALDVSGVVLDAPAGKQGFVQVKDGHFYDGQNKRLRFWGVNMVFAANFPDKTEADAIAERIANLGFNIVRLHHMDTEMTPKGIWKKEGDQLILDPEQLDRLDYFVAQLKQRGVYVNMNLHVGRKFTEAEGVVDADDLPEQSKVVTMFDDRLLELQKQYAQDLLTHYNPYTQTRYNEEPAVALVEITNENSIFPGWMNGTLFSGENSLPDHYIKELDQKWLQWLKKKYPTDQALAEGWELDGDSEESLSEGNAQRIRWTERENYSKQRLADDTEFYYQLEKDYFRSMLDYLHTDLQVRVPITTSNNFRGQPDLLARTEGDYMDVHNYWDHPEFPDGQWDSNNFTQTNLSIIRVDGQTKDKDSFDTFLGGLALCAVDGKPLVVSEWNSAFPNDYEYEAMPIITAYSLLQDWDGLFLFSYSHNRDYDERDEKIGNFFDISNNPVKLAQSPQYAMAFIQGMVQPAKQTVVVKYWDRDVIRDFYDYGPGMDFNLPQGIPTALLYNMKLRKQFHAAATSDGNVLKAEELKKLFQEDYHVSDTQELAWDMRKVDQELLTIDTKKLKAAVGFLQDQNVVLKGLELKVNQPAAFTLVSRDGRDITDSSSMLISLVGKQQNSGQAKNAQQGLTDWGEGPVLLQKISGTIRLEVKEPEKIRGYYLSPQGERLSEIKIKREQKAMVLQVESPSSPLIEIIRE